MAEDPRIHALAKLEGSRWRMIAQRMRRHFAGHPLPADTRDLVGDVTIEEWRRLARHVNLIRKDVMKKLSRRRRYAEAQANAEAAQIRRERKREYMMHYRVHGRKTPRKPHWEDL